MGRDSLFELGFQCRQTTRRHSRPCATWTPSRMPMLRRLLKEIRTGGPLLRSLRAEVLNGNTGEGGVAQEQGHLTRGRPCKHSAPDRQFLQTYPKGVEGESALTQMRRTMGGAGTAADRRGRRNRLATRRPSRPRRASNDSKKTCSVAPPGPRKLTSGPISHHPDDSRLRMRVRRSIPARMRSSRSQ